MRAKTGFTFILKMLVLAIFFSLYNGETLLLVSTRLALRILKVAFRWLYSLHFRIYSTGKGVLGKGKGESL